jgi:hypothetical protein
MFNLRPNKRIPPMFKFLLAKAEDITPFEVEIKK